MNKTLIVVDDATSFAAVESAEVLSFEDYLAQYPKVNEPKTRVINLCDTRQYLSKGYYCSLLAEARQHRVLPTLAALNDLRQSDEQQQLMSWHALSAEALESVQQQHVQWIFFGWCENPLLKKLARDVFQAFAAPILRLELQADGVGARVTVQAKQLTDLDTAQSAVFEQRLAGFCQNVWRTGQGTKRKPRWDLAILVNDKEDHPPSDKEAIRRFVKAAEKLGMHAELISEKHAARLGEFDALFVRETTAIDHHTYRMARQAEQEGLVVIDDPTSILRCCNKVFLHDAFSYNKVPSLRTLVSVSDSAEEALRLEAQLDYPMVLKLPEGSFSRGVFKVENRDELLSRLSEMLAMSALVLVQEFLYTDYDWRIGVLNGRAVYACRYHMARKHWQIYNHGAKRFSSGGFDTLPTFEVPKSVLDAALKACAMIGKGLYGVDIKQKDNQVYVIEVNDNPSIEHGVEDKYLGNELYMLIMQEFVNRLEMRGK